MIQPSELRRARQILQARAAELIQRTHQTAAGLAVPDAGDDVERALSAFERDRVTREIDVLQGAYKSAQAALQRLDAGTYGICADCGDPISANRLRAVPHAERCTPCQELADAEVRKESNEGPLNATQYQRINRCSDRLRP